MTIFIQRTFAVYKVSFWLLILGFLVYSLIIGFVYWKVERQKIIVSPLKHLHINLTVIPILFGLVVNNFNILQEQLLLTFYSAFPFIKLNNPTIYTLTVIFILVQIIFVFHLSGVSFFAKQRQDN